MAVHSSGYQDQYCNGDDSVQADIVAKKLSKACIGEEKGWKGVSYLEKCQHLYYINNLCMV